MKLTFAKVPISGRVDGPGFRVPDDRLTRLVTGTPGAELKDCQRLQVAKDIFNEALAQLNFNDH